jgi:hypothetical protein
MHEYDVDRGSCPASEAQCHRERLFGEGRAIEWNEERPVHTAPHRRQ